MTLDEPALVGRLAAQGQEHVHNLDYYEIAEHYIADLDKEEEEEKRLS